MRRFVRKAAAWLLCLAVCLTLVPAAHAAEAVFVQPEPICTDGKLALVTLRQLFPKELTVRVGGETKTVACEWECIENYDDDLREFHFAPVLQDGDLDAEKPVLTVVIEGERETPPNGLLPDASASGAEPYDPPRRRGGYPSYYNAYELGLLPAVENQGKFGLCWAFSLLGCMTTDLILDGAADTSLNLSELQLGYYTYHTFYDEKGCNDGDEVICSGYDYLDGGTYFLGYRTLANMVGCAAEQDVPYEWGDHYLPGPYGGRAYRAPQLTGAYELPVNGESGRDGVKDAILRHGSVAAGFYMDHPAYYSAVHNSYYGLKSNANHAVMLVGWDDNFPKENFAPYQPETDGAWLVRNSWGAQDLPGVEFPDYGVTGYFWASYDDACLCRRTMFAFDAQPWQYDHCYGYDASPEPYVVKQDLPNPTTLSQRFRVDGGERIDAVGIETQTPKLTVTVTLTCSGETVTTESRAELVGYHLIPLDTPLTVAKASDVTLTVTVAADDRETLDIVYQDVGDWQHIALFRAACDSGGFVLNGELVENDAMLKLFTTDTGGETPVSDGLRIDAETFPNPSFRVYVSSVIDRDRNGYLSERERNAVTEIDLSALPAVTPAGEESETAILGSGTDGGKTVSPALTMKGVEHFPSLRALNCIGYRFSALDVTQNPLLETLDCSSNDLAALDVSNAPLLRSLKCGENRLAELDVTHNPLLETLICSNNQLTELDVTQNPLLETLECYGNQLTTLDVTQNPLLTLLAARSNLLTELNVTQNPLLTQLYLRDDLLTELDLSHNPELRLLNVNGNSLTALDLSHNPKLLVLRCAQIGLTELELSAAPDLYVLEAQGNDLTTLDLRGCERLSLLRETARLSHPSDNGAVDVYEMEDAVIPGFEDEYARLSYDGGVEVLTAGTGFRIVTEPESQTVYVGETVTFSVAAEGEGLAYQWYMQPADSLDWAPIEGADTPELTFTATADMDSSLYVCYVTKDIFRINSNIVFLTVLVHMGDTNADGTVDMRDLLTLRQAMSGGYGVTVGESADLNHDGEINMKDLLLLRRHLAGGYGVVLE